MEIIKKNRELWRYKIILKEKGNISNNSKKTRIINNCLKLILLCRNYYFNIKKKRIKTDIIRYINKLFKTNYINNNIKRIIIKYNNKTIYKTRSYNKAKIELNININNIKYKKFKKIKKIKELDKFKQLKRNLIDKGNWYSFITNENYPDKVILLDPIMDNLEINIITDINNLNNNVNNSAKIKTNTFGKNIKNKLIKDRLIENRNKIHVGINPNKKTVDGENNFGNFIGSNPNFTKLEE